MVQFSNLVSSIVCKSVYLYRILMLSVKLIFLSVKLIFQKYHCTRLRWKSTERNPFLFCFLREIEIRSWKMFLGSSLGYLRVSKIFLEKFSISCDFIVCSFSQTRKYWIYETFTHRIGLENVIFIVKVLVNFFNALKNKPSS